MAASSLSEQQLRSSVAEVLALAPGASAIGVRTAARWEGRDVVEHDGRSLRVVWAPSVLELREALAEAEEGGGPVVVLTPLDSGQVGRDVLGRLARGRLYTPDLWQAVLHAFKARRAADSLREGALAQALLDYAPPDGYPPVPTGVLDEATAWRALYRHAFGVDRREPDLTEWLRWAASEAGRAAYEHAPQDLRRLLHAHVAAAEGPAEASVLTMVDSGVGADAIALAIACGVVFTDPMSASPVPDAAVRLERYFGEEKVEPAVGSRLAGAAREVISELRRAEQHREANRHVARADELLDKLLARPEAHRSPLSVIGYNQRLERLGRSLTGALERPSPESVRACEDVLRAVAEHDQARLQPTRLEAAEMAVRLVRWPGLHAGEITAPAPFAVQAASYVAEGSFVDRARDAIVGGDPLPALAASFTALEAAAARRRAAEDHAFASALVEWSAGVPAGELPVPIEQSLARFVAPAAKGAGGMPVLLIVLDGLSWAIAQPLFEQLRRVRWHEVTPLADGRPLPPVVATLPTITEVSRASLLAGRVCRGNAAKEKGWFAEHPALRDASRSGKPPVLFHKADIDEGGRGRLHPEVRAAIDDDGRRVVGVVVNAVDDHLAGSNQIEWPWTLERIRPLQDLLEAAFAARRLVAIAADHGHVLHREGAYRSHAGAGSRWRPDDGPPQPDEVRVAGPRVLGAGDVDRAILPWGETTRYGLPRNGYHGGATPREALAPFALFSPVPNPSKSLVPCWSAPPEWWLEAPPPGPPPGEVANLTPVTVTEDDFSGMSLFQASFGSRPETTPSKSAGDWVDRLLASEGYAQQRQLASKLAPGDEQVVTALRELDRRGGRMTPAVFAARLGLPPMRLGGFVAQLQRLLNVDGYGVLGLDRDRDAVTLDLPLLKTQFELE